VNDQRGAGFARVVGGADDIGAYEVQSFLPPRVQNVTLNDGAAQRSRVLSATVNFDSVVLFPTNAADAFQLKRQSDNAMVVLTASVNANQTSVTLTFSGAPTDFGSLADGRYTLTVLAAQVTGYGGSLDGNGDGVGGDDYVLVGAPGTAPELHRLFGDSDGDGDVDAIDFLQLRASIGLVVGDPGFNSTFDFTGDGDVDAADFAQLRLRFGSSI